MDIWQFLSDPANQKTLGFYGGGLVTAIGGIWVWMTRKKKDTKSPPPVPTIDASRGGQSSGRDSYRIDGNATIGGTPPLAWGVLALGILMLGAAAIFGGNTVTQSGTGVAAGGNVSGVTINNNSGNNNSGNSQAPQ